MRISLVAHEVLLEDFVAGLRFICAKQTLVKNACYSVSKHRESDNRKSLEATPSKR